MRGLFLKIRDKLFLNSVKSAFRDESALLRSEIAKRIDDASDKQSQALDLVSARQGEIQAGLAQLAEKVSTLEKKLFISEVQRHYQDVRKEIAERIKDGEKLRFASYVVYDTTFGAHGICELMLKEPEKYDVTFVVCPDTYRDMDGLKQYHKTKQFFVERYGADRVLDGYDETTGEFLDHSDKFDVVYLANPYDCLVNRVHGINYLSLQNVLTMHLEYSMYLLGKSWSEQDEYRIDSCLYYRYFVNTPFTKRVLQLKQLIPVGNVRCFGYPKIDRLAFYYANKIDDSSNKSRKRILIAPHQTIKGMPECPADIQTSNFLQYAEFIPRLADLYPDIDFVFRPHPLLFTQLVRHKFWTQEDVDSYLKLLESKNIVYSSESDYFHLFLECDAIIHDCCSYIAEWLFTQKPACFVIETKEKLFNQLTEDGKIAIEHYYLADSEQQIVDFIDKVRGDEIKVTLSEKFKNEIVMNYPKTSEVILRHMTAF